MFRRSSRTGRKPATQPITQRERSSTNDDVKSLQIPVRYIRGCTRQAWARISGSIVEWR